MTQESKHTPGPLKVQQQWAGQKLMAVRIVKASEPYIGLDIASMDLGSGFATDTSMDYANLFAAAPELLEALQAIIYSSDAVDSQEINGSNVLYAQAYQALSKARGGV
jgi:hypothetical protein